MKRAILYTILILLYSTTAMADSAFQFHFAGVRLPDAPNVKGMRLVLLYGTNEKVGGLDLGLASFNESDTQSGFTFNMGISRVTGESSGCACALINIHEGEDKGLNASFINVLNSAEKAVNISFVNLTEGNTSIEIGGLTMAKKSKTQIGFVNFAEEIETVQIGFLNFAENGFFPMFPFFNFPKQ